MTTRSHGHEQSQSRPAGAPDDATRPGSGTAAPTSGAALPAWILVGAGGSAPKVAALPVLDRLLVGLHRAGYGPISVVTTQPLPRLPRATAWRIPYRVVDRPPARVGPTLVVVGDTLVEAADLRRLAARTEPTRLAARDGTPLPVGWVPAGAGDPEAALAGLPAIPAEGVALRVRGPEEARTATRALWASITSASDGFVDRVFNRPAGRPLSRLLVHTPVTPNAISVGATLIGLLAAAMFAVGRPAWMVAAAVMFQVSAVIDCVDGDVARAVFKETKLGKWLDIVGDQVVHGAVFAGITVGLLMGGSGKWVAGLGASAMAGAALSFLVVLRGWRTAGRRGGDSGRMQKFLDAATNRDFSVLVLVLAVVGKLDWFLWLAGVGSHLFWMTLLGLQLRLERRAGGAE